MKKILFLCMFICLGLNIIVSQSYADEKSFPDVYKGSYYYDAVMSMNEKGYMTGYENGLFGSKDYATREQVITVIWRMDSKPEMEKKEIFPDIKLGKYYTDAVIWAYNNNIATGYQTGMFGKGDNITRQDFTKMLYGYLADHRDNCSSENFYEAGDYTKVSSYAKESMIWATANGLIGVNSDIRPKEYITRRDICVMLDRCIDKFADRLIIGDRPMDDGHIHTYVKNYNMSSSTEPTCTKKGCYGYECTRCMKYKEEIIPELGHEEGKWEIYTNYHEKKCKRCGAVIVESTGHVSDEGVIIKESTCVEKGITLYTCVDCGYSEEHQDVPRLKHNYGDYEFVIEPTCEKNGYAKRKCFDCNREFYSAYMRFGHNWDNGEVSIPPTCEADGEKTTTCLNCGKKKISKMCMLGHDWNDGETVKESTCTEKGLTRYTCLACGKIYEIEQKYKDHRIDYRYSLYDYRNEFGEWIQDKLHYKGKRYREWYCLDCENHGMLGYYVYDNGLMYLEDFNPDDHNLELVFSYRNCNWRSGGYYDNYVCSDCGNQYYNFYEPKHNYVVSYREIKCLGCDDRIDHNMYGEHVYRKEVIDHQIDCIRIHYIKLTCEICGRTSYLEGDIEDEEVHLWDEGTVVKKPTEDAPGIMKYTCLRCMESDSGNEVYKMAYIPKIDIGHEHIWKSKEIYNASFGLGTYVCEICGKEKNINSGDVLTAALERYKFLNGEDVMSDVQDVCYEPVSDDELASFREELIKAIKEKQKDFTREIYNCPNMNDASQERITHYYMDLCDDIHHGNPVTTPDYYNIMVPDGSESYTSYEYLKYGGNTPEYYASAVCSFLNLYSDKDIYMGIGVNKVTYWVDGEKKYSYQVMINFVYCDRYDHNCCTMYENGDCKGNKVDQNSQFLLDWFNKTGKFEYLDHKVTESIYWR